MAFIHGFELLREQDIPELNTKARLFRHVKTGAELLSLENDDENKVFGITFRTPPQDSTGIAHIMEHSVLCGSRKYPVKEPFVELMKSSLNTFLNAFTYPDKTCYPVASQNLQDFYNLIDVYMDAVLYPLIPPHVLQQEGWHYELEQLDDPLTYKGVVFNEMKGAYSDPDSLLGRETQHSLFPESTYGVDSGGDPRVIPNLTYAQFKAFHDTYYHPSNARIYFYGDDQPDERLRRMDEYLRDFEPIPVNSAINLQPQFDQPRQVTTTYAASESPEAQKGQVTVNWLLPETGDPRMMLSLNILSHILVGTPASPLRKALIDSGLGDDLTGSGLEEELRQMYFSTGLKGIAVEDAGKVEDLILKTLTGLAHTGIDPDMIAAAVNTTEFRLRENNTGSFPRGLLLMLRSLTTWLYGKDPIAPLRYEAPLGEIKHRLEAGDRYFEDLIRQHLLENSHRTTVLLKPDPQQGERMEAEERQRLDEVRAGLSQAELQSILENTHELQSRQETPDSPEALATIPALKLSDIDRKVKTIPNEILEMGGTTVLYHDLFTNGIVYLDLGFDLRPLPQELLPYVSLFGRALTELGTRTEDFVKLSQRIGRSTGGIWASTFTSAVSEQASSQAWMFVRGKATSPHAQELLDILQDVLLTVKLDNQERFRQMVLEEKAGMESGLVPAGHRVVNSRLRAQFNEADWVSEQMKGISYLFFLRALAQEVDRDWTSVLEKLERVRQILLNRGSMICNVTVDATNWKEFAPQLTRFLDTLPRQPSQPAGWKPAAATPFEGLTIPAQVNYVGKGANLYQLGYEYQGSILVITNHLRNTWLWERVRVKGGAYGAFCLFDHHSGVLTLLSYRDPNLLNTLENYDLAGQFLSRLELNDDELSKSIIGAIGDLDAYQLPDAKGYTSMIRYLVGENDEKRQRRRDQILSTRLEDFHAFGSLLERLKGDGHPVVVLGSQDAIESANASRPGWLQVTKIL